MANKINNLKFIFKGKDFSLIPEFSVFFENQELTTKISDFVEVRDENNNEIDIKDEIQFPLDLKNNLTNILIRFLDSFNKRELTNIFKNIDEKDIYNEKLEKKKLYTTGADGKLYFNGQIGFLRKKDFQYIIPANDALKNDEIYNFDITLRCQSRFDEGKKAYFLCSMLLHSDLSFVDSLVPTDNNDDVFEYMLLFRYISLLRESFTKGFYKKYVSFQNNDDRVKGNIDIARHLMINCGYDNGKIAYTYRENTVRNPLNMLIIEAYKKLRSAFPDLMETCFTTNDEDIINSLRAEVGFINYSIPELIKLNNKNIYHPFYFEYEGLRQICLKILRDEGMDLFSEEEIDESNGFLVYIPNLWEKFLQYYFEQIDEWKTDLQFHQETARSIDSNIPALACIPDFVFSDLDGEMKMMLDAKFKPKWYEATKDNKQSLFSDVEADYNKCIRDMNALEIHKTGVIFPVLKEKVFKQYAVNSNDMFYAFGVNIPKTESENSFFDWNIKFENNIKKLIENEIIPIFKS